LNFVEPVAANYQFVVNGKALAKCGKCTKVTPKKRAVKQNQLKPPGLDPVEPLRGTVWRVGFLRENQKMRISEKDRPTADNAPELCQTLPKTQRKPKAHG